MLVMDLQNDALLRVPKGGLEDSESIDVCPPSFVSVSVCTDVRSFYRRQVRLATLRASPIFVRCAPTRPILIAPLPNAQIPFPPYLNPTS
jgi:hypothetical protein